MKRFEFPISLDYEVNPSDVCGGVRVDTKHGHEWVQVKPQEEHPLEGSTTSLWEYVDRAGNVRACMLRVAAGDTSPRWHIMSDADPAYYEMHRTVAGTGSLALRCAEATEDAVIALPAPDSVAVLPGEDFSIHAHPESTPATYVLATFSGAPFEDHYEQRVN